MTKLFSGDTVELNGKKLTIRSIHAAGAHTSYIFVDGSTALDVEKAVASGKAKFIGGLGASEVKEIAVKAPTNAIEPALKKLFDGQTAPSFKD